MLLLFIRFAACPAKKIKTDKAAGLCPNVSKRWQGGSHEIENPHSPSPRQICSAGKKNSGWGVGALPVQARAPARARGARTGAPTPQQPCGKICPGCKIKNLNFPPPGFFLQNPHQWGRSSFLFIDFIC